MQKYLLAALLVAAVPALADDGTPTGPQVALNISADMRKATTVDVDHKGVHISPTVRAPSDESFDVRIVSGTVLIIIH